MVFSVQLWTDSVPNLPLYGKISTDSAILSTTQTLSLHYNPILSLTID